MSCHDSEVVNACRRAAWLFNETAADEELVREMCPVDPS